MKINKEALELIKEFEGVRLEAYPDPGSKDGLPWTIGYGHTKGVKRGDKITLAQAEAFLIQDLEAVTAIIQKYVKVAINENQEGALHSFVLNIGEGLFAKSSVLKYINENKLNEVPGRLALYRMNDGKVMAGLVRRRTAEGALWMKPVATVDVEVPTPSSMPAQPAPTQKPWDWGAVGAFVTLIAGVSGNVKKIIGDFTTTFGVDPSYLLIAIGVGFAGYTIYSKWRSR